ncbi:MAG TPA: hypothetical protein VF069_07855 [Streptosporangiaceae bacterium]
MDVARWVIYALLSTLTAAVGIICLVLRWHEVGISLLSAGIASALFLTQKVVDDLSQRGDRASSATAFAELGALVKEQAAGIANLRHDVAAVAAGLGQQADTRVTIARHLTAESMELIRQLSDDEPLEIDAVGISLKQLIDDHEATFTSRRRLRARLVILDPGSATFDLSVTQEGRDATVMRGQVKHVLAAVARIVKARRDAGWDDGVEIRLLDGIMTTTGIRVAETWFFRPRFVNESNSFQFFFERYDSSSPECYRMVTTHFATLWDLAHPVRSGAQPAKRLTGTRDA